MLFNDSGIDLKKYNSLIKTSDEANLKVFMTKAKNLNLRNSIFVDNTASPKIAESYRYFLSLNNFYMNLHMRFYYTLQR